MKIYQLKAQDTVLEVRDDLQRMVNRGHLEQEQMKNIVRGFAREKANAQDGQRYVTVII